jgi:HK97 family phage prohead protease
MNHAYSLLTIKSLNADERVFEGVCTTPEPDRAGDVVEGCKFRLPLPVLYAHAPAKPVGTVVEARTSKAGIWIRGTIPKVDGPPSLVERIETCWSELKAGLLRGISVGFRPLVEPTVLASGGLHYTSVEILECSLCVIPMNSGATVLEVRSAIRAERKRTHVVVRLDAETLRRARLTR